MNSIQHNQEFISNPLLKCKCILCTENFSISRCIIIHIFNQLTAVHRITSCNFRSRPNHNPLLLSARNYGGHFFGFYLNRIFFSEIDGLHRYFGLRQCLAPGLCLYFTFGLGFHRISLSVAFSASWPDAPSVFPCASAFSGTEFSLCPLFSMIGSSYASTVRSTFLPAVPTRKLADNKITPIRRTHFLFTLIHLLKHCYSR